MKLKSYASSSSGNLYSVTDGQTDILIECGVPYAKLRELIEGVPTDYDACIVTHRHGDHYNTKTAEELKRRGVPVYVGDEADMLDVGTLRVKAFTVVHDVENYGFLIKSTVDSETFVFIIDSFYSPCKFSFSPTIFAIECNWARDLMQPGDSINDRLFQSHMSLDQCIRTLRANDLSKTREIHLLHLSDSRSDEARFVREVEEATGIPTTAAKKWGGR